MSEETGRRRPITAAQWAHARAVGEGGLPTRDRIAGMLDCSVTMIYEHARLEGWKRLDFRRAETRAAHADFIELARREDGEAEEAPGDGAGEAGVSRGDGVAALDRQASDEDPVELLRRGTALLSRRLG